jgi:outer membrane protein assembly factor BamB
VIGDNGNLLVGAEDEHLYAIAANGTLLWHLPLDGDLDTTPAIAKDGTLYVCRRRRASPRISLDKEESYS